VTTTKYRTIYGTNLKPIGNCFEVSSDSLRNFLRAKEIGTLARKFGVLSLHDRLLPLREGDWR
jgi:hypothetical protein